MSNGFIYRELSDSRRLNTTVNKWIQSELVSIFGKLPIILDKKDLGVLQAIVDDMHELNKPSMQPLLDLIQEGKSVLVDRDY